MKEENPMNEIFKVLKLRTHKTFGPGDMIAVAEDVANELIKEQN